MNPENLCPINLNPVNPCSDNLHAGNLRPINLHAVNLRIVKMRGFVLILPWLGFLWQSLLAQSGDDLLSALLAAIGTFVIFFDSFRPQRFYCYPLSTLVVIGFAVTLQLGPLLLTAVEGHTITYNLLVPVATFGHGLLSSVLSLVAHAIYRQSAWLVQLRASIQHLLVRLGLFVPLRTGEIIAMGLIGLFALAISSWFSGLVQSIELYKFIQGFQLFSIVPIAFVLRPLWIGNDYGLQEKSSGRYVALFLFFLMLTVVVSIGGNSRAGFVGPLACLSIGLALEWLYGLVKIRLKYVMAVALTILLLLPLVTDLATAMVMVRGLRSDISPAELLDKTLVQLQDREAIHKYRKESDIVPSGEWSEAYVSNLFLARFANAKFPDNSLEYAGQLSSTSRDEMASFHWWRVLAQMPSPVLSLLGVSSEAKAEVNSYSFGDKLCSLATGSQYVLGSFRTGHYFGTGMAAFGFAYLPILLASLLLIFPLLDAQALAGLRGFASAPIFSVVAITQFIAWFTLSNSESVVDFLVYPLRGLIQPVLLYALGRWLLGRMRFV